MTPDELELEMFGIDIELAETRTAYHEAKAEAERLAGRLVLDHDSEGLAQARQLANELRDRLAALTSRRAFVAFRVAQDE